MQKFGSVCYTYKQDKGKLDSRCDQGHFLGYDKNSPAYLVYHPDTDKVQKHRLVKFVSKVTVEKQTQTLGPDPNDGYDSVRQPRAIGITQEVEESAEGAQEPGLGSLGTQGDGPVTMPDEGDQTPTSQTDDEPESRRYPTRDRKKPSHLGDFLTEDSDSDGVHITIDYTAYHYRVSMWRPKDI